jgi:hypothetical protein
MSRPTTRSGGGVLAVEIGEEKTEVGGCESSLMLTWAKGTSERDLVSCAPSLDGPP